MPTRREIGRNYQTELGVVADAKLALAALVDGGARTSAMPIAVACAHEIARGAPRVRRELGAGSGRPISSRCGPNAS